MKKSILNILFLLFPIIIFSQKTIDSIQKYIYNDNLKADYYTRKFLNVSFENENLHNQIQAYYYLGYIKRQLNDIDSSLYFYNKGHKIAKEHDLKKMLLNITINKAILFYTNAYYKDALNLYQEALTIALNLNDDETVKSINVFIALIKLKTGKVHEAIRIFKKSYSQEKNSKDQSLLESYIAQSYLETKLLDSASLYIHKGLYNSHKNNDTELNIRFIILKGELAFLNRNYKNAKKSYLKALKNAKKINSKILQEGIEYNIAKLYKKEGNITQSNKIIKAILASSRKKCFEELTDYYKLLAENYKEIDSLKESNFYFEKFAHENNKQNKKRFSTTENLHQIDLEKINTEKESQKKQKIYLFIITLSLIIVFVLFYFRNKKLTKQNQVRFDNLMQKIKAFEIKQKETLEQSVIHTDSLNKKPTITEDTIEKQEIVTVQTPPIATPITDVPSAIIEDEVTTTEATKNDTSSYIIKDEKVFEILKKLKKLEEKEYYLKQECTLHNVAKKLKTNTAYLSKIVNNELDKNFSTYINELRINYAIIELKNNSRLRSYSTKAIAEEMGYKSSDSFTRYFKIATGISPSVYIKKINDL